MRNTVSNLSSAAIDFTEFLVLKNCKCHDFATKFKLLNTYKKLL